jgi:hypothetical protein
MIRIFLLVILLINAVMGSTFQEAQNALSNKDYEKAIELFKQSAKYGNNEANFKLGVIYYKGNGVKKDLNLAMKYFQRAAVSGHMKAKYNTGVIYASKKYKKHNYKEAYTIFNELAVLNYASAQNKLGLFLLHGLGIEKDYKKAVKWFEESYFENHYLPASCNLALMYASGKGVFPNFGRARELAQEGYDKKLPVCIKVYEDFNLHKYGKDKGFKFGFYK